MDIDNPFQGHGSFDLRLPRNCSQESLSPGNTGRDNHSPGVQGNSTVSPSTTSQDSLSACKKSRYSPPPSNQGECDQMPASSSSSSSSRLDLVLRSDQCSSSQELSSTNNSCQNVSFVCGSSSDMEIPSACDSSSVLPSNSSHQFVLPSNRDYKDSGSCDKDLDGMDVSYSSFSRSWDRPQEPSSQSDKTSNPDIKVSFDINALAAESSSNDISDYTSSSSSTNVLDCSANAESSTGMTTPTFKRVLHGQQPKQGDVFRDPTTCDLGSRSILQRCDTSELHEDYGDRKLNFCCVDYKKKKVSPVREINTISNHIKQQISEQSNFSMHTSNTPERETDMASTSSLAKVHLSVQETEDMPLDLTVNKSKNQSNTNDIQSSAIIQPGTSQQGTSQSDVSKNKITTDSDTKNRSSCMGKVAQSRLCLGSSGLSQEDMETQSFTDLEAKCLPVRPSCNNHTATSLQTIASVQKTSTPAAKTLELEIPQRQFKTRKSRKGKSRKIKERYLIFTKGSETYTPHQIGIKRIKPLKAFNEDGSRLLPNVTETTYNNDQGADSYDDVDQLIDMHGHIIGMALSPDHR